MKELTEAKAIELLDSALLRVDSTKLDAGVLDYYKALALISKDILADKREKFHSKVAKNQLKSGTAQENRGASLRVLTSWTKSL